MSEKTVKKRIDLMLFERGYAESREKAKALLMAGIVFVNGQKEDKAGTTYPDTPETQIEVKGVALKYVSRGGLKLEKAMKTYGLDLTGKVCMDIGASTGGFTDCMLQGGATKVFAVDVGHGQLAWKLRNDDRVVCMEKTNIRYITPEMIGGEMLDFASVDVSFISLKLVLPPVWPLLKEGAEMVCLIKPQFEAGREEVGKKGVVRDKKVHEEVVRSTAAFIKEMGFIVKGLTFSPIRGPEGNIEYLIYIRKPLEGEKDLIEVNDSYINKMVEVSHNET
ncbi:MAG: TlyA family RNA methyltransferase [Eubacteriales bacterium]|nr:TlyA family RNA methyltransferase [Eubacteriales bacterium]